MDDEELSSENDDVGESKNRSHLSGKASFVKSFINDVVSGETQLQKEEIETVKGEIIDDGKTTDEKSRIDEDLVIEAKIIDDEEDLNIFND